jgi:hypothetical protein
MAARPRILKNSDAKECANGVVMSTWPDDSQSLKSDRRSKKRNKQRFAQKGTPWTKLRNTTEEEVRLRETKRKRNNHRIDSYDEDDDDTI